MATVAVERTGTPLRAETVPSEAGPTSSRESAYRSRVAPTTHARAQPKALTAAPMVMSSPTHPATNRLPRSPSSEPDAMNALTPFASVPKPITSTAVTKIKYSPPKMATPRIARGMSRLGSCASSPRVAAASNPAKERKPKTTPRNTADRPVPLGTVTTEKSTVLPLGAVPVISLNKMITLTMRMSATVVPSMTRRTRVPPRIFEAASANASGTARPTLPAVPCGLMLAAIEGAIRASEMPTASHRCSSRRRGGLGVLSALLACVDMKTPLLVGIRRSKAGSDRFHGHLVRDTYRPYAHPIFHADARYPPKVASPQYLTPRSPIPQRSRTSEETR